MATMTARPTVPGPGATLPSEDDDSWISDFRLDLKEKGKLRRQELGRQAEDEFKKSTETRDPVTKERARQRFEQAMSQIDKMLEDEITQHIEQEKALRHWSRLGRMSPDMSEAMIREQQMIWNAATHSNGQSPNEMRSPVSNGQPHTSTPRAPSPNNLPRRTSVSSLAGSIPERWIPPVGVNESTQEVKNRGRQKSVSGFGPSHSPDESYHRPFNNSFAQASPSPTFFSDSPLTRRMTEEPEIMSDTDEENDDGDDDGDEVEEQEERSFGHVRIGPSMIPSPEQRRSIPIPTGVQGPHKLWRPSLESLKSQPSRTMGHVVGAPGSSPTNRPEHFGIRDSHNQSQKPNIPRSPSISLDTAERFPVSNAEREAAEIRRSEELWQSLHSARAKSNLGQGVQHPPSAPQDVRPRTAEAERLAREGARHDPNSDRFPSSSPPRRGISEPSHIRREPQIWHPPMSTPLEKQRTPESLLSRSLSNASPKFDHQGQASVTPEKQHMPDVFPFSSSFSGANQEVRSSNLAQPTVPLSRRPTPEVVFPRQNAPPNSFDDWRPGDFVQPTTPLSRRPTPEVANPRQNVQANSFDDWRPGMPLQSAQTSAPLSRRPTPDVPSSRQSIPSSNANMDFQSGLSGLRVQNSTPVSRQSTPEVLPSHQSVAAEHQESQSTAAEQRPRETFIPLERERTPYSSSSPVHSVGESLNQNTASETPSYTQTREMDEKARQREEYLLRKEEELRQRAEDIAKREEAMAKREEEDRRLAEISRRSEELRQREEAIAKKEAEERRRREEERLKQDAQKDAEERRREEERIKQDAQRKQDELKKKAEDRQVRQQEELWKQHEARKQQEEARRKDEEFRRREEDIKRKKQESTAGVFSGSTRPTGSSSSSVPPTHGTFPGRSGSTSSSSASNPSSWAGGTRPSNSTASDSTRPTSTANSTWTSGFPGATPSRPTSTASSNGRPSANESSSKSSTSGWRSSSSSSQGGSGASSFPSTPPTESEWQKRQEEQARKQQEQFRREAQRQEHEKQAKSAQSTSKEQIIRAWNLYEQAWAAMKEQPTLRFRGIPWPVLSCPTNTEELTTNTIGAFVLSPHHTQDKPRRDRIKEQLLRWHPDRFEGKWLSKVEVEDKEAVRRGVGQVVRGLNELMARESSPFA